MTFQLIRTYTCGRTQGFVYLLDGRRCASLAKSLKSLKTRLGVASEPAPLMSGDWLLGLASPRFEEIATMSKEESYLQQEKAWAREGRA